MPSIVPIKSWPFEQLRSDSVLGRRTGRRCDVYSQRAALLGVRKQCSGWVETPRVAVTTWRECQIEELGSPKKRRSQGRRSRCAQTTRLPCHVLVCLKGFFASLLQSSVDAKTSKATHVENPSLTRVKRCAHLRCSFKAR